MNKLEIIIDGKKRKIFGVVFDGQIGGVIFPISEQHYNQSLKRAYYIDDKNNQIEILPGNYKNLNDYIKVSYERGSIFFRKNIKRRRIDIIP